MIMNARFLAEAKELESRWKKSGLLDGLEGRFIRATCAVLLESQRLMNEICTDEPAGPKVKNFWLDRKKRKQ